MESRRFQDSDLEDIHFGSRKFQKRKGGGGGGTLASSTDTIYFTGKSIKMIQNFISKKGWPWFSAQPTLVQIPSAFIIKKVNVMFPVLTIFVHEQLQIGRGSSETSCNQPGTLTTRKPVAP